MRGEPIDRATAMAVAAHNGHVSMDGQPYVFHSFSVMRLAAGYLQGLTQTQRDRYGRLRAVAEDIVAVLHDAMGRGGVPAHTLANQFGNRTADAVGRLTRQQDEPYMDYIARIGGDAVCCVVKLACLQDHLEHSHLISEPDSTTEQLVLRWESARELLTRRVRDHLGAGRGAAPGVADYPVWRTVSGAPVVFTPLPAFEVGAPPPPGVRVDAEGTAFVQRQRGISETISTYDDAVRFVRRGPVRGRDEP